MGPTLRLLSGKVLSIRIVHVSSKIKSMLPLPSISIKVEEDEKDKRSGLILEEKKRPIDKPRAVRSILQRLLAQFVIDGARIQVSLICLTLQSLLMLLPWNHMLGFVILCV
ncbi:hypothetical protein J5N97_023443 [Dioscorea zingiberensis]|uniref:Uncharacterized protein n=1 Tax=Dioscorea zingiberensis TaxID=325984 RepID=A0A9D5H7U1_9LILI|nr:hypothetical protein J5N97_023443 [Dioscorea zingiberensis]